MNNFIRRLKASWTYLKFYPVLVIPDDYWTSSDAKALSNFMSGDTGSKLRNIRFRRVYESQQNAITNRADPAYSAGIAFGILGMTSEEDSLLQISLPENASQESADWNQGHYPSVNR